MAKETKYEDQGYGAYFPIKAIAEEFLRQEGKPVTEENVNKVIQSLAKENAESYTPNPELGKNPSARVAKQLRMVLAAPLLRTNGVLENLIKDPVMLTQAKKDFQRDINGLAQNILHYIYGFKTKRHRAANLKDPREITDFEYLAKGGALTPEELMMFNKTTTVNQHLRYVVECYLYWAITPLLVESKQSLYKMMLKMGYKEISHSVITRPANIKEFLLKMNIAFGFVFSKIKIPDLLGGLRWTPKGLKKLTGKTNGPETGLQKKPKDN